MSELNELPASKQVDVPWTADQVASLNGWQTCGYVHPFTGSHGPDGERYTLIATSEGWIEEEGGEVVQTWAHSFMADWSWKRAEGSIWMGSIRAE